MNERKEIIMWGSALGILGYSTLFILRLDTELLNKGLLLIPLCIIGAIAGIIMLRYSSSLNKAKENIK